MQESRRLQHEIEFLGRRLAEEEAAARSTDPEALVHLQLARDYAAVLEAYRSYAATLHQGKAA